MASSLRVQSSPVRRSAAARPNLLVSGIAAIRRESALQQSRSFTGGQIGDQPFMPPPPSCTACCVQEAGSTTRKLMGRPFELVSVGAIAPSMEQ